MADKIIGRFYFKLTDSKNLIGEFSNNLSKRNYTESAVLKSRNPDDVKFVGDYLSTWYEEKSTVVLSELKIWQKTGHENIFSLTWRNFNGKTVGGISFWGEGILCDGILIGDYRNFEIINPLPGSVS